MGNKVVDKVEKDLYFNDESKLVTRGELADVLTQVLGQVDEQLKLSFEHLVEISNLVDVVTQALVMKGLIVEEDLTKAKEAIINSFNAKLGGEEVETN